MGKEFIVLYTSQKTKKAKTWHDGVLKLGDTGSKATLYDDKKSRLDVVHIKLAQVIVGEQLESDRYLFTIEEEKSLDGSQTNDHPPPPVPPCPAARKISTGLVHRPGIASRSGAPRMGLKRKTSGFIPPRQIKQPKQEPPSPEKATSFPEMQTDVSAQSGQAPMFQQKSPNLFSLYSEHGKTEACKSEDLNQGRMQMNGNQIQSVQRGHYSKENCVNEPQNNSYKNRMERTMEQSASRQGPHAHKEPVCDIEKRAEQTIVSKVNPVIPVDDKTMTEAHTRTSITSPASNPSPWSLVGNPNDKKSVIHRENMKMSYNCQTREVMSSNSRVTSNIIPKPSAHSVVENTYEKSPVNISYDSQRETAKVSDNCQTEVTVKPDLDAKAGKRTSSQILALIGQRRNTHMHNSCESNHSVNSFEPTPRNMSVDLKTDSKDNAWSSKWQQFCDTQDGTTDLLSQPAIFDCEIPADDRTEKVNSEMSNKRTDHFSKDLKPDRENENSHAINNRDVAPLRYLGENAADYAYQVTETDISAGSNKESISVLDDKHDASQEYDIIVTPQKHDCLTREDKDACFNISLSPLSPASAGDSGRAHDNCEKTEENVDTGGLHESSQMNQEHADKQSVDPTTSVHGKTSQKYDKMSQNEIDNINSIVPDVAGISFSTPRGTPVFQNEIEDIATSEVQSQTCLDEKSSSEILYITESLLSQVEKYCGSKAETERSAFTVVESPRLDIVSKDICDPVIKTVCESDSGTPAKENNRNIEARSENVLYQVEGSLNNNLIHKDNDNHVPSMGITVVREAPTLQQSENIPDSIGSTNSDTITANPSIWHEGCQIKDPERSVSGIMEEPVSRLDCDRTRSPIIGASSLQSREISQQSSFVSGSTGSGSQAVGVYTKLTKDLEEKLGDYTHGDVAATAVSDMSEELGGPLNNSMFCTESPRLTPSAVVTERTTNEISQEYPRSAHDTEQHTSIQIGQKKEYLCLSDLQFTPEFRSQQQEKNESLLKRNSVDISQSNVQSTLPGDHYLVPTEVYSQGNGMFTETAQKSPHLVNITSKYLYPDGSSSQILQQHSLSPCVSDSDCRQESSVKPETESSEEYVGNQCSASYSNSPQFSEKSAVVPNISVKAESTPLTRQPQPYKMDIEQPRIQSRECSAGPAANLSDRKTHVSLQMFKEALSKTMKTKNEFNQKNAPSLEVPGKPIVKDIMGSALQNYTIKGSCSGGVVKRVQGISQAQQEQLIQSPDIPTLLEDADQSLYLVDSNNKGRLLQDTDLITTASDVFSAQPDFKGQKQGEDSPFQLVPSGDLQETHLQHGTPVPSNTDIKGTRQVLNSNLQLSSMGKKRKPLLSTPYSDIEGMNSDSGNLSQQLPEGDRVFFKPTTQGNSGTSKDPSTESLPPWMQSSPDDLDLSLSFSATPYAGAQERNTALEVEEEDDDLLRPSATNHYYQEQQISNWDEDPLSGVKNHLNVFRERPSFVTGINNKTNSLERDNVPCSSPDVGVDILQSQESRNWGEDDALSCNSSRQGVTDVGSRINLIDGNRKTPSMSSKWDMYQDSSQEDPGASVVPSVQYRSRFDTDVCSLEPSQICAHSKSPGELYINNENKQNNSSHVSHLAVRKYLRAAKEDSYQDVHRKGYDDQHTGSVKQGQSDNVGFLPEPSLDSVHNNRSIISGVQTQNVISTQMKDSDANISRKSNGNMVKSQAVYNGLNNRDGQDQPQSLPVNAGPRGTDRRRHIGLRRQAYKQPHSHFAKSSFGANKRNLCGDLVFPSKSEVETNDTPERNMEIPFSFVNAGAYKQIFTAALREHLNIQLFQMAKSYHGALAQTDLSKYEPSETDGFVHKQIGASDTSSSNPVCEHGCPSKMVQVKKEGPNQGRFFYACNAPRGQQCKFFKWTDDAKKKGNESQGQGSGSRLRFTDPYSIAGYFKGQNISLYCECQILWKSSESFRSHSKNKFWSRKWMEAKAKDERKLFIHLSRREGSAGYAKGYWTRANMYTALQTWTHKTLHRHGLTNDLWIISQQLTFDPKCTFQAKSVFYGPNSFDELELEPLSGYCESNWRHGLMCHAIHAGNVSSELVCMTNLQEYVNPSDMPILPSLLHIDKDQMVSRAPARFTAPSTVEKQNTFFLSKEERDELCDNFIHRYRLNQDQARAMRNTAAMFCSSGQAAASPVTLIHGVFGAGKSYLLAVMVVFLCRLFDQNDVCTPGVPAGDKILISSTTNVAVDRILSGLLDVGFEDFIRVGSIKKIAKPVLPYSVHATGSDNLELKELQEILKSNITPAEKQHVRRSIERHKKGENKRKLGRVRVVGVTCAACTFHCLKDFKFSVVLLDECSQMTEPASLLPIARFQARNLVLVGDPKQLDPTIQGSEAAHDSGLEQTMFDRLTKMGMNPVMLRTQYRCHPVISAMANKLFYCGQLFDGVTSQDRPPVVDGWPSLCFFDVANGHERCERGGSFSNEQEVGFVVFLLESLMECEVEPENIGVITLYKAQLHKVTQALQASRAADSHDLRTVQISTVDAFQGGERDIIILSCVRTQSVGFIDCDKRINVALTRAKKHLFIVGHQRNLSTNKLWASVINHCQDQPDGFQHPESFKKRTIEKLRKEAVDQINAARNSQRNTQASCTINVNQETADSQSPIFSFPSDDEDDDMEMSFRLSASARAKHSGEARCTQSTKQNFTKRGGSIDVGLMDEALQDQPESESDSNDDLPVMDV